MSNLLVISIFAVITLALVLWFFLRLDKEKQVSQRYFDALQKVQVELRNVEFEKDRLGNEKLVMEKQIDIMKIRIEQIYQMKTNPEGQEVLIRDKKTGRFVKVSK